MDTMDKLNLLNTGIPMRDFKHVVGDIFRGVKDAPYLHKILRDMTGDTDAALLLELLIYWDDWGRKNKPGGWWYKTLASWEQQGGLSRRQVERGRKILKEKGLAMSAARRASGQRFPPVHFRLNWLGIWDAFRQACKITFDRLTGLLAHLAQNVQGEQYESYKASSTETPKRDVQSVHVEESESSKTPTYSSTSFATDDLATENRNPLAEVVVEPAANAVPQNVRDAWDATLNQLEAQLDRASFNIWLRGSKVMAVETSPLAPPHSNGEGNKTVYVIGVRNMLAQEMLQHRLYTTVQRMFGDQLGERTAELRFEVKKPEALTGSWFEIVDEALKPQSPAAQVRALYEQHIGALAAADAEWLECVADLYDLSTIKAAIVNTKLQNSRKRIADPAGYMNGVLANMGRPKPVKTLPRLSLVNQ